MSFRASNRLSGAVHASIAAMGSIWLIEPSVGLPMFESLRGVKWDIYEAEDTNPIPSASLHVGETGNGAPWARDANGNYLDYRMDDGVAILEMSGPMQKQDAWSMDGTSTVRVRRAVRQAVADPGVHSLCLIGDSPGGSVAGTHELAMDVRRAGMKKPTYGFCEDMCCSACYYVMSQCNALYAASYSMVGSIGVYATLYDLSQMAEAEGVVVHVIKDGEEKGDGVPGTPITGEMLQRTQSLVDTYGAQFRKVVSETRFPDSGLKKGESPARGEVFIGAEARRMKLIDGVTSLDNVLNAMKKRKKPMS